MLRRDETKLAWELLCNEAYFMYSFRFTFNMNMIALDVASTMYRVFKRTRYESV